MNKASGSGIGDAAKALGFKGMWAGLGPRIIMIGTLTALQWFIYDGVKVQLRLPRPPPCPSPSRLSLAWLSSKETRGENQHAFIMINCSHRAFLYWQLMLLFKLILV